MNQAQVISVNPARKTPGELNISEVKLSKLTRAIAGSGSQRNSLKGFLNFIYGLNSKTSKETSTKLFLLRLLCGGTMLALTVPSLIAGLDSIETIAGAAIGVSLISGLFSRVVSACAMFWSGYMAISTFMSGNIDTMPIMSAILMGVFCILGPGRYSIDQLSRNLILSRRTARRRRQAQKNNSSALDYRAFITAERRI